VSQAVTATQPDIPAEAGNGSIEVEGVAKTFRARQGGRAVDALHDVHLSIPPGSFMSFVGPSGCGKSTLLNIIAGLLPATRGSVRIDGTPVAGPRRSVGIMFQTPELFPWRSVLENTLLPVDVFGKKRSEHVDRARSILEFVGLAAFEKAYARELSGGMQQRVALSRTLMADPEVLLMDEPFGALDEFTRERLNLELLRIWTESKKTVIFVTHNIGEAVFLSDRVVVMGTNPGRVLADLTIGLPRPRDLSHLTDPVYLEAVLDVRRLLGVEH
jgi:NitT/TauT family transport system ATP-binding protein